MFELASKQSRPITSVAGIDALSSSWPYDLAANSGTRVTHRPSNHSEGDFAAGLRTVASDAGVRGDFATGMTSTTLSLTTGDFATGLRTRPTAERVRGNFATGQHPQPTDTPRQYGQPATHRRSRRLPHTVPAPESAS
ncbi:MAG: hypothetical protein ABSH51_31810 [Solirubrobacteraceae bacterium]|jgi:hypothetical protein